MKTHKLLKRSEQLKSSRISYANIKHVILLERDSENLNSRILLYLDVNNEIQIR